MKRMNIIASAGAWGYGPCATLRLLLDRLTEFANVDFIGKSVALDFAYKHASQFKNLYNDIRHLKRKYNLAISIMEPDILLWSKKYGILSISIDNLYWMWTWDDSLLKYVQEMTKKIDSSTDITEIRKILRAKGEYADYSVMYTLSDKIYWQKFCMQFPDNLKLYKEKIEFINPIIENISYTNGNKKRDKILVSFSGMINPYVDDGDLYVYLLMVKKILDKAEKKIGNKLPFIFTVHESMLTAAGKIFYPHDVYSFSHPQFINALNTSLLVIAPAGMATIYECLAYNTPFFILPEQHDGSYINYKALCDSSREREENIFRRYFPEALLSTRIKKARDFDIANFYKFYLNEIIKEQSPWFKEVSSLLLDVIDKTETEELSNIFAARQRDIVSDIVGDFNGVEQFIQSLMKLMKS